jgi:hypothetical protein
MGRADRNSGLDQRLLVILYCLLSVSPQSDPSGARKMRKTKLTGKPGLWLLIFIVCLSPIKAATTGGEAIVVTGGVSLWKWEKTKLEPHDHWWLNFIRASRIRIEQLQQTLDPSIQITWLLYGPAYQARQAQEPEDLFSIIRSVQAKYGVKLILFSTADQLCDYLNRGQDRRTTKIVSFDYFGHSNSDCMMFDYSNEVGSASKAWLHKNELRSKLKKGSFAKNAHVQSWGCYQAQTVEGSPSMATFWHQATGVPMTGAIGKTQYMLDELPILSSPDGRWVSR